MDCFRGFRFFVWLRPFSRGAYIYYIKFSSRTWLWLCLFAEQKDRIIHSSSLFSEPHSFYRVQLSRIKSLYASLRRRLLIWEMCYFFSLNFLFLLADCLHS